MKRRLGIAQAIIGSPKVIIVDEPTTGLDPEERIRFRNILSDVSDRDVIIILSTHIVGDISSTCKKLALLNRGKLRFEGSPDDMIELARGKVWEVFVTDAEFKEVKERYPIISTIPSNGGWDIQIVAEICPDWTQNRLLPILSMRMFILWTIYCRTRWICMRIRRLQGICLNDTLIVSE